RDAFSLPAWNRDRRLHAWRPGIERSGCAPAARSLLAPRPDRPRIGDQSRRRSLLCPDGFHRTLCRLPDAGAGPGRAQDQGFSELRRELQLFARAARPPHFPSEVPRNSGRDAVRRARRAAAVLAGALLALPGAAAGLKVGVIVPEFEKTTLEGRRFSLAIAEKTHNGVVVL